MSRVSLDRKKNKTLVAFNRPVIVPNVWGLSVIDVWWRYSRTTDVRRIVSATVAGQRLADTFSFAAPP
jgi:hypothetical protein